jgi:mono/diheme cytochrome c family protein
MALVAAACGGGEDSVQAPPTTIGTTTTLAATTSSLPTTTTVVTTSTTLATTTTVVTTTTMAEPTVADVYATNCAACHGAELEGGVGPGLGSGGHAPGHADAELVGIITNGKNAMPGFVDKLTEQQIVNLVAFIRDADDSS